MALCKVGLVISFTVCEEFNFAEKIVRKDLDE